MPDQISSQAGLASFRGGGAAAGETRRDPESSSGLSDGVEVKSTD